MQEYDPYLRRVGGSSEASRAWKLRIQQRMHGIPCEQVMLMTVRRQGPSPCCREVCTVLPWFIGLSSNYFGFRRREQAGREVTFCQQKVFWKELLYRPTSLGHMYEAHEEQIQNWCDFSRMRGPTVQGPDRWWRAWPPSAWDSKQIDTRN